MRVRTPRCAKSEVCQVRGVPWPCRARRGSPWSRGARSEMCRGRVMRAEVPWSRCAKSEVCENFGQDTSPIGHQAHGKLRPRHIGHRSPSTRETSRRGQGTSAIGHQAHGKRPEGAKTHRRSPSTRETSAKTHRPSVTKHTGNFGQGTSAIGHQAHGKRRPRHMGGHQAHGKLRPRHIGHRSPSTRTTLAKTHRPLVTAHTGNFGQDTSAIGHQAHGKLWPRHIGHRSPSTRET